MAKIRNRYNQAPQLIQDTNGPHDQFMRLCYLSHMRAKQPQMRLRTLLFYSYFNDCVSLIVRSHIQTHVQNIQMARKTKSDKMTAFARH